MISIPIQVSPTEYDVLIAFERENIERIQQQDPAEFNTQQLPPLWQGLKLRMVIMSYCGPEDEAQLLDMVKAADLPGIARFLTRGFKFQPERGDHDNPYESLK